MEGDSYDDKLRRYLGMPMAHRGADIKYPKVQYLKVGESAVLKFTRCPVSLAATNAESIRTTLARIEKKHNIKFLKEPQVFGMKVTRIK